MPRSEKNVTYYRYKHLNEESDACILREPAMIYEDHDLRLPLINEHIRGRKSNF